MQLYHYQQVNWQRALQWHESASRPWSVLEWAGAMCGEAGEAANVAKKILRLDLGTVGNKAADLERPMLVQKLGNELADTIGYTALVASATGIDLEVFVKAIFNAKSEELGFPQRL